MVCISEVIVLQVISMSHQFDVSLRGITNNFQHWGEVEVGRSRWDGLIIVQTETLVRNASVELWEVKRCCSKYIKF